MKSGNHMASQTARDATEALAALGR
jgi:hypothetical protein